MMTRSILFTLTACTAYLPSYEKYRSKFYYESHLLNAYIYCVCICAGAPYIFLFFKHFIFVCKHLCAVPSYYVKWHCSIVPRVAESRCQDDKFWSTFFLLLIFQNSKIDSAYWLLFRFLCIDRLSRTSAMMSYHWLDECAVHINRIRQNWISVSSMPFNSGFWKSYPLAALSIIWLYHFRTLSPSSSTPIAFLYFIPYYSKCINFLYDYFVLGSASIIWRSCHLWKYAKIPTNKTLSI